MISVHSLPNGLRVVLETIPFVRSVSFGIWVKNGSRNECEATNGLSHYIEHMMFKGTRKRTARQIADTMDAIGGQLNAFTSRECTCFFSRTLDTQFDTALDCLQDMFFNSNFDEQDIEKERGVILEELSMFMDSPEELAVEHLHKSVFPAHPLGLFTVGTEETIGSFRRDDIMRFFESNYTADRLVISIAGNIDEAVTLEKITAVFGKAEKPRAKAEARPAVYVPGLSLKEKDIEQVHLCLGLPGLPSGADETYALACVSTVLGGGMSSRLFQKIREERGLVYSVYSFNQSYEDTGVFQVYAALGPDNLHEVLELVSGEIKGMFLNKIGREELGRVKEQLKSNFLLSLESSSSRMSSIGRSLLLLDRIVTPDELVRKIDGITLDKFYEVCETIFRMDKMSLSLVGKRVGDMKVARDWEAGQGRTDASDKLPERGNTEHKKHQASEH